MSGSGESWFSWLQDATDKVASQSTEIFGLVKNDIQEIKKVVSDEVSSLVGSTSSVIKEKLKLDDDASSVNQMKRSMTGFLSHVSDVFTPPPDDADEQLVMILNQNPIFFDQFQSAKWSFCSDPSNFIRLPSEDPAFEKWLRDFEPEKFEDKFAEHLRENEVLRKSYESVVPNKISRNDFCLRYFFEMEKLAKAEEKRQIIKNKAKVIDEDSDIIWDEDEMNFEQSEISEDMQRRLLEDYEKEINNSTPAAKQRRSQPLHEERKLSKSSQSTGTEDEWERLDSTASMELPSDDSKLEMSPKKDFS